MNKATLTYLHEKHGLLLDSAQWRRTDESCALITGLEHLGQVKILCTNGNLAYFETAEGRVFDGHIQHFEGEVEPWGTAAKRANSGPSGQVGQPCKHCNLPIILTASAGWLAPQGARCSAAAHEPQSADPVFAAAKRRQPSKRAKFLAEVFNELFS